MNLFSTRDPEPVLELPAGLVTDRAVDERYGDQASAVFGPAVPCAQHPDAPTTKCHGCHPHRYALTRQWMPHLPWFVYVMLNPSTADAFLLDPTITRCRARALRLGAGGLVVLNAYGLRSTDPRGLRQHPDPVGWHNDAVAITYLSTLRIERVIVGWGSDPTLMRMGRDRQMLTLLRACGATPWRIGPPTGVGGQPRHPLYLGYDLELEAHAEQDPPRCEVPDYGDESGTAPKCLKPAVTVWVGRCRNGHTKLRNLCTDCTDHRRSLARLPCIRCSQNGLGSVALELTITTPGGTA